MRPGLAATALDTNGARDLTERIRRSVDQLWELLAQAHDGRAWAVLGYQSWKAYITAEFAMSEQHSYRLLDQAHVIQELELAAGDSPIGESITEVAAEDRATVEMAADKSLAGDSLTSATPAGKSTTVDPIITKPSVGEPLPRSPRVNINEHQARRIKPRLAEVTDAIRAEPERVVEIVNEAVTDAINENDRRRQEFLDHVRRNGIRLKAAAILGVSVRNLYERAHSGHIAPGVPVLRIGSRIRVPRARLLAFAHGDLTGDVAL